MCPTCRVPVSDKEPFKRIIGSMEVSSTMTDKTVREQMRRTRFEILFQEYEKEINNLEQQLDEVRTESRQIKEINEDLKTRLDSAESQLVDFVRSKKQENKNGDSQDIGTILKLSTRLQDMMNYNSDLKEQNASLKKQLQDVMRKNETMKEEMDKLSFANNYNMSPKKFSRYTVAALETKVDAYEREISRLKRALERSDEYIEDLKRKNTYRNHFDEMRMTEPAVHDGTFESAFTAPSSSSHNIESPLISMQRRIDELATVALATSNSSYSNFNGSSSHSVDIALSGQVQHNVTPSEHEPTAETPTPRSIFEDPSKFPACAKLIELTKVRRDLGDQAPVEILPLDASGRLIDRISNHSNSPRLHSDLDDNRLIKTVGSDSTVSRNVSKMLDCFHDKPSTCSISAPESCGTGSSPSSPFTAISEVSCSKLKNNCDSGTDLRPIDTLPTDTEHQDDPNFVKRNSTETSPSTAPVQSYPSAVTLPYDTFMAKRIKLEDPE